MAAPALRHLLLATLLLIPCFAVAQPGYRIELSPDLYGRIVRTDPDEVFSPGFVTIHRKKDGKQLIRVDSEELTLDLHEGRALANIKQLPYGEQSAIHYEDVNFDGVKDLAVMDGQNSCYHGPSFQIYLGVKGDPGKFVPSAPFTELAQKYCGMFQVDHAKKLLHTMTKSGCCWHQYSTYRVIDGLPRPIDIVEQDQRTPGIEFTEEAKWDGKKMVKKREVRIDPVALADDLVFSFDVERRDAKVVLFRACGDALAYALIRKDGHVDFLYPKALCSAEESTEKPAFRFESDALLRSLIFGNSSALYTVYENLETGEVGIGIVQEKGTVTWKAIPGSEKGSLDLGEFRNVEYRRR
ncbi:XAC2610-related protein [Niveibacterium terrae]|uniref:XAC2610-related protein n=1 Tax=Niveibacterium terrae TaxID=3373598 RepID=UPI003A953253